MGRRECLFLCCCKTAFSPVTACVFVGYVSHYRHVLCVTTYLMAVMQFARVSSSMTNSSLCFRLLSTER